MPMSVTIIGVDDFADDFARPDSADPQNGWTEKNPVNFTLASERLIKNGVGTGYRDNATYRPASESRSDVETSVEFRLNDGVPGYPQLFARLQSGTVAISDSLDGYILYVDNSNSAVLGRQTGQSFVEPLAYVGLTEGLNTQDTYRLRMSVTGTAPVDLTAWVERLTENGFVSIGSASAQDSSPQRISGPGVSGFGGHVEDSYSFDNFRDVNLLSGAAGTPAITTVSPDNVTENGTAFTMLVNGSNFIPNSVVRWNGDPRPTTYISPTNIQALISAEDIAVAATAEVTVYTPPPSEGLSNIVDVLIVPADQQQNPVPSLNNTSPSSVIAGSAGFQVTVTGGNFVSDSVVRWNGANRQTAYISENTLQATINASDVSSTGSATITVFNPQPGGGESSQQSVAITAASEFLDDFERPDGNDPFNGWTEKNPAAFALGGGTLQKLGVSTGYLQNAIYRPVAESRLDVETSVELSLSGGALGYPQIFARLQPGTVATPDALDGYMLYIDNDVNRAIVGRQRGSSFVNTLATIALSEALVAQETYRLRLRVSGTNPVTVSGFVERLTQTGFVVIGEATATDSSGLRLSSPGMSCLGGYIEQAYSYDNFRDTDL